MRSLTATWVGKYPLTPASSRFFSCFSCFVIPEGDLLLPLQLSLRLQLPLSLPLQLRLSLLLPLRLSLHL